MKFSDIPESIKKAIIEFVKAGESQEEVALIFGYSRWMVRRVLMDASKASETVAPSAQLDTDSVRNYLASLDSEKRLEIFYAAIEQSRGVHAKAV